MPSKRQDASGDGHQRVGRLFELNAGSRLAQLGLSSAKFGPHLAGVRSQSAKPVQFKTNLARSRPLFALSDDRQIVAEVGDVSHSTNLNSTWARVRPIPAKRGDFGRSLARLWPAANLDWQMLARIGRNSAAWATYRGGSSWDISARDPMGMCRPRHIFGMFRINTPPPTPNPNLRIFVSTFDFPACPRLCRLHRTSSGEGMCPTRPVRRATIWSGGGGGGVASSHRRRG